MSFFLLRYVVLSLLATQEGFPSSTEPEENNISVYCCVCAVVNGAVWLYIGISPFATMAAV